MKTYKSFQLRAQGILILLIVVTVFMSSMDGKSYSAAIPFSLFLILGAIQLFDSVYSQAMRRKTGYHLYNRVWHLVYIAIIAIPLIISGILVLIKSHDSFLDKLAGIAFLFLAFSSPVVALVFYFISRMEYKKNTPVLTSVDAEITAESEE